MSTLASTEDPFVVKLRSVNTVFQEEVESVTERLETEVFIYVKVHKESQGVVEILEKEIEEVMSVVVTVKDLELVVEGAKGKEEQVATIDNLHKRIASMNKSIDQVQYPID